MATNNEGDLLARPFISLEGKVVVPLLIVLAFVLVTYAEQTEDMKNVAVIEKPFQLKSLLELVGLALKGKPIGGNTRRIQTRTTGAAGSD